MSIYLIDHPPARKQFNVKRASSASGAIVLHDAECNPVYIPSRDNAAEKVAKFISERTTAGSYHSIVDSDSIVRIGKYEWEMYHEGTGGNRWSLGLSFACNTKVWTTAPPWWIDAILTNGAIEAANMNNWLIFTRAIEIPANRITADEYRDGLPGFVSHGALDPTRRSDPGVNFPWAVFLDKYRRITEMTDDTELVRLKAFVQIDWAYRNWLNRTPTESELTYWLGQAEKDGLDSVKKAIQNSPEAMS